MKDDEGRLGIRGGLRRDLTEKIPRGPVFYPLKNRLCRRVPWVVRFWGVPDYGVRLEEAALAPGVPVWRDYN